MSDSMRAWAITRTAPMEAGVDPLQAITLPRPRPNAKEVLIRVHCCAVCHTELDEIEGRTAPASLPMVPGHQVVGTVTARGAAVNQPAIGSRVGVAWIWHACGQCPSCRRGEENLCEHFEATGRDRHGGYADFMVAPADFVYPLPDSLSDEQAAPLLCAGAIGYRSLRLAGVKNGEPLGLTGFGGSNHLVLKLARALYPGSPVLVWARSDAQQQLARSLGAHWAGDTDAWPPFAPRAVIDTTPVYKTVLAALERLAPGGRLVINAIRKESVDQALLAELDYPRHLWLEKEIKSVANVTRRDVADFIELAARHRLLPETRRYPFAQANRALLEMRFGAIHGAKVLAIQSA